jgi:GT2 family glycosyltransferase
VQLTVVMPTYNRPDALPRSLDALSRQTLDPGIFELVLVEDAKNEFAPVVGQRPFAVRVLRATKPGASAARNIGWRAARAPVVVFLGDDIIGAPDLLEQHAAWHEQRPEDATGVLGHVRWARELKGTAFMRWLNRGIQFDYGTIRGTEAGAGHFYTANVSLKRSMLERTGGFDEDGFPFIYEDIDLGIRLFEHGFRLVYNERATAEHLHQPRLEEWRVRMARTAPVERRWIERHPGQRPYFHDRFADALRRPPVRGRKGRLLMGLIPRSMPVVGERIWANGDLYFRQQLGKPFMDAWNREE